MAKLCRCHPFHGGEARNCTPFNSLNSLVCQVLRIKIIVEGNEFREIEIYRNIYQCFFGRSTFSVNSRVKIVLC